MGLKSKRKGAGNERTEMARKTTRRIRIDNISKQKGLNSIFSVNEQSIVIESAGNPDDFANIGAMISSFKKQDWFVKNVAEWLFYDTDNGVEDLIHHYGIK